MKFLCLEKSWAAVFAAVFFGLCVAVRAAEPAPQLILTDARLAELKELAKSDAVLRGYVADVLMRADGFCKSGQLKHKLTGPRLLSVSRDMLARTYALGLAFRWTGEKKYLEAEAKNLQAVCDFPDWNPSHFLDVAEMTHAVAIGYDWLRRDLKPESREHVRLMLRKLGLAEGLSRVVSGKAHWTSGHNNWTQVCCAGLIIGALAVRDTDPKDWETLKEPLLEGLRKGNKLYAPEGAWDEGVAYWHYATAYLVYGLAAMESALGTDFDLSKAEGLNTAARFPVYVTSPTMEHFCFADDHAGRKRNANAELFWLAHRFNLPEVLADEHQVAQTTEARAAHVIWYATPPANAPALDRAKLFNGRVPVAVLRAAWGDSNAWWVAVKAGDNMVSHGHLDLGSFEMEADGVRWVSELGSDDYNMPGYFGGNRWTYFRLQTASHNVFTLDGTSQLPKGASKLTAFGAGDVSSATIDLSGAYPQATKAVRTVSLNMKTTEVRVSDEITLAGKHDVAWGITTAAEIALPSKREAVLKQRGRSIRAFIESPGGAEFSIGSSRQESPQNDNEGYRRLEVKLAGVSGEQKIMVKFSR